jgi:8-oxo-dGTP pyrophosphatase MutT (NUDIX family)
LYSSPGELAKQGFSCTFNEDVPARSLTLMLMCICSTFFYILLFSLLSCGTAYFPTGTGSSSKPRLHREYTKNKMSERDDLPRINSISKVASTKWLELQTIDYTDEDGKDRKWDLVSRTTKPAASDADAVVVIPLLQSKTRPDTGIDTIIIEQFRPPVGVTVEFPAGLIDEGETAEQAALRELREETGYVGEACKTLPKVSRPVCMSPGLTDESVKIVVVTVDLDNPYNKDPKAELDDGEHIRIKRVPLKEGLQSLLDQGTSMPIEGLYMFAIGLELGKTL